MSSVPIPLQKTTVGRAAPQAGAVGVEVLAHEVGEEGCQETAEDTWSQAAGFMALSPGATCSRAFSS